MKASELRIGNWVYEHYMDEGFIPQKRIFEIKNGEDLDSIDSGFTPIPLTEEWLLKFGFKKWGRNDMPRTLSYEFGKIKIFPSNSFCDFSGYGFMWYKPDKDKPEESAHFTFKYVHQLQNLYFCITGEELTISE